MSIKSLNVGNFKGVARQQEFDVRPITFFIGANSSGKSSCIHAISALAQTLKVGKVKSHIVLDDENAHVHLGRFIEVLHSKDYKDQLNLGISLGNVEIKGFALGDTADGNEVVFSGDARIEYAFKSTKRTQEISLARARLSLGESVIDIDKFQGGYRARFNGKTYSLLHSKNFFFNLDPKGFSGGGSDSFKAFFLLNGIQSRAEWVLNNTLYLGPFRQSPARRYPFRGACPNEVGYDGGATVSMLANEALQSKKRPHSVKIGGWLEKMGLATALDVSRTGSSELFDVNVRLADNTTLPLPDLGYGMSQVLPVLAQCTFATNGATLLFEQPELHLHSTAARKLAHVFAETVNEKSVRIIAETHSRELFHESIDLVRKGILKPEDVVAYDVSREDGESRYRKITLVQDADGSIEVDHPWGKSL